MFNMKNHFLTLIVLLSFVKSLYSQNSFLKIVLPEKDTTKTSLSSYRFAGSVPPGFKVFNNNKELKVYKTGAFVDFVKIEYGVNVFNLIAISPNNDTLKRTFYFVREEPKTYFLKDTLAFIEESLQPKQEIWAISGDIIQISFIASPNLKAFINDKEFSENITSSEKSFYSTYRLNIQVNDLIPNDFTIKIYDNNNGLFLEKKLSNVKILKDNLPIIGEISKDLAYFNTSLGGDRLGGEKLHYTEKGVRIFIDGKNGSFYRVKLSNNLKAWIDTSFVKILDKNSRPPYSIMGNFSFYGEDNYDVISIPTFSKVPYWSYYDLNKNVLIVDLFYLQSNSNWQTDRYSSKIVDYIQTFQLEDNVVRFEINFKQKQIWGYSFNYISNNTLQIKIKHPPKKFRFKDLKIAVDAGHGGDNLGALGSTGVYEKDINLSIAKFLIEMLKRKGATVLEIRPDDSEYKLNSIRAQEAKNFGADILISIHCNSIAESSDPLLTKGTSCFYKHFFSRNLAKKIYDRNLKLKLQPFGLVGNFNFLLNAPTEFISVLVETAFLSNPEDEELLIDPKFQKKIAEAIFDGIDDFLDELD